MVIGDVNGDVTTVLERADEYIKDNRLTPIGFTMSHEVYDTTIVAGTALLDTNFNFEEGEEGSGSDRIIYKAPMSGYEGNVNVTARVHYQSVPPKWNAEMFMFTTPEIDSFREMYNTEGADPVMIKEVTAASFVQSTGNVNSSKSGFVVFPNPVREGDLITVTSSSFIQRIEIYSLSGKLVHIESALKNKTVEISTDFSAGGYLMNIITESGENHVQQLIVR
jgi:hypothetical protein